jgi:hypothetical protein
MLALCLTAGAFCFASPVFADTTITITNTACTNPPPPADVSPPTSPSAPSGEAAMRDRKFALARANFRPLVERSDVEGMRLYGMLLLENCTGLQDKAAGAQWLGKAAEAGDVMAQGRLAAAYLNGDGVAEDDGKAFDLFNKAAASGNANAEEQVGYLYLSGRGVASDKYQGMVWSVKAGEQGNPFALVNIAQAYFRGGALPQDNDKAAYYMYAAIERATGNQRMRFVNTTNNISRALSEHDLQHAADRAKRWSPGPRSLSDVLDDAARRRDKGA